MKRDTPLAKSPSAGQRKKYGKQDPPDLGIGPLSSKPPKVSGYVGGSGTASSMTGNVGLTYSPTKNSSINVSGYGGKDEYGGYGGYQVTGSVNIPIGQGNKKRRRK